MSTLKLYHFPLSAPSRGAMLAANLINVPFDTIIIDLFKKEQLGDNFLKINPQHCVPTLDDDGFILWESRAIACYLAEKYGDGKYYPIDLQKRAIINQRLYFDSSFLYPKTRAICYPILFGGVTEIKETLKDDLNASLGFLDQFLSKSKWVAGDEISVADTSILATMASIMEIGWDISAFPNLQRWLNDCKHLPGYEENLEGAKLFGAAVKKNLKN